MAPHCRTVAALVLGCALLAGCGGGGRGQPTGGIHAKLGYSEGGGLRVLEVPAGGGADLAGIRPNDVIIGINGTSVRELDYQTIVEKLRGPVGSRNRRCHAPSVYEMSEIQRTLGIIGGSGLDELEGLANVEQLETTTAFGAPSDAIIAGTIGHTRFLFLPRHGRGHRIAPHRINYRANILALKMAGAEQILSVSAVGSMKEDIHPGDMIIVDQFIDRTRHRIDTFFDDDGVVAHVEFAEARRRTRAVSTFVWKARSFRHAQSQSSTDRGTSRSSA